MPANNLPIFTRMPQTDGAGAVIGPSANTATDGTGANMYKIFQADATNGSFVHRVIFRPVASPAATVARLWLLRSTASFVAGTTNLVTNTFNVGELSMPAITVNQLIASTPYELVLNFGMEPGHQLLASFGTSTGAAGNGYNPVVIAGAY